MDRQYQLEHYHPNEIDHQYGDRVHILNHPLAQTLLAKFSTPHMQQPLLNLAVRRLTGILLDQAVNTLLPREEVDWPTRMQDFCPKEGRFQGEV